MENSFEHHNELFHLKVHLEGDTLFLLLTYLSSSQKWRASFTDDQLPKTLTENSQNLKNLFLLLESPTNFNVEEGGIITLILRTIVQNSFKEVPVSLELNLVSEPKKELELPTSEMGK